MEQLFEFIGNHLFLVGAFIIVSGLLFWDYAQNAKNNVNTVQAIELVNNEDAVILDIRSMVDYNKGHIINAINIPFNSLKSQLNQLQKYKEKPIIVTCRTGAQSSMACKQLRDEGFVDVYNLSGGILSWENANMPISQS